MKYLIVITYPYIQTSHPYGFTTAADAFELYQQEASKIEEESEWNTKHGQLPRTIALYEAVPLTYVKTVLFNPLTVAELAAHTVKEARAANNA